VNYPSFNYLLGIFQFPINSLSLSKPSNSKTFLHSRLRTEFVPGCNTSVPNFKRNEFVLKWFVRKKNRVKAKKKKW
jgi:hypothetical protein